MTTVVFHNGIIAADTRETSISRHGLPSKLKDNVIKLAVMPNGPSFRGEKILVISGSGSSNDVSKLQKAIALGEDFEKDFATAMRYNPITRYKCSLMLVCSRNNYIVNFPRESYDNAVELKVTKYTKNKDIAIGSGGSAALLSIKKYGNDIVTAVKDAMLVDEYTGGSVMFVNTKNKNLVIENNNKE